MRIARQARWRPVWFADLEREDERLELCVRGDRTDMRLIFPLDQVPEMNRGRGVRLQRYKDGGLSDATGFAHAEGLSWRLGGSPACISRPQAS